ncbi:FtsK/SpoIIIE domain-containing protein [Streptacidiphilus sp. PAMC 29251]
MNAYWSNPGPLPVPCRALVGPACSIQQHPTTAPVVAHHSIPAGTWLLATLAVVVVGVAVLSPVLQRRWPVIWWYLAGFPVVLVRIRWTWRKLTILTDLAVPRRPARLLLGAVIVKGDALKPVPPRLGFPHPLRGGLRVRVKLHPGQIPEQYAAAAEALVHAWRVHAVRVMSDVRGYVTLTATAWDPLTAPTTPHDGPGRLLAAVVGQLEDGAPWVVDLRRVPHWLIVGATRSGKSTLIAALVTCWAPQPLALVGIDLKGGMELALFHPRLTALATNRTQAAHLLKQLVEMATERMALCRTVGARSIWDLPEQQRPVPVVVIVDEVAELFLMATRADKDEVGEVATALLRLAQLGAALGVHLIVAGQRVGSDLGPGVTALRAQLAGRVCHRVSDPGTAEMALGDLNKDALAAAQQITFGQAGVAVTFGDDGQWTRARSTMTTPDHAQLTAEKYAHLTPAWGDLGGGSGADPQALGVYRS